MSSRPGENRVTALIIKGRGGLRPVRTVGQASESVAFLRIKGEALLRRQPLGAGRLYAVALTPRGEELAVAADNVRGVAAYSPLDAQLDAWLAVDPELGRVGMLVGEGHDDLVAEASRAAERHGIDLHVRTTHSDQETLYAFRRMSRDIDGFWLFPDNRILSGRVLQEMLSDAKRQQVPVTAPSESMLELGATLSISTVAADIARTIVKVIREVKSGNIETVPPITQLSEIRVLTSGAIQVVGR